MDGLILPPFCSPSYVKKVEGEGMPVHNSEEYKVEFFGQPL